MPTQSDLDATFLESLDWTVECESPFEIRHADGSFATGQAAKMTLMFLRNEAADETGVLVERRSATPVTELLALVQQVEQFQSIAAGLPDSNYDRWKRCFALVFSDECSVRIGHLFDQLNLSFEYYSPDLDYEDDVRAYCNALVRFRDEVTPFFAALPPER